jgi:hypothetical protein
VFGRKKLSVEVRRLKPEPGDILVLKYDGKLTEAEAQRIKATVEGVTEHKAMVLTEGMSIDVLEPDGTYDLRCREPGPA